VKHIDGDKKEISSKRDNVNKHRSSRLINMADFMGIKKSESIESFYEIQNVIGRGAFGEVVKAKHLFSNEYRAIKIIEKKKINKHSILMQLQL
jgi:serine/threonine protein kinase